MHTSFRRSAIAAAAAAGLVVSGLAAASAQNVIPGDTDPGQTIFTDREGVTVTIDEVDRETGAVSGTFVNEFGSNLNCTSPDQNPDLVRGGTVSTAAVVEDSMSYYTQFQNTQAGRINAGSNIVITYVGLDVPFWPLFQLLPTGSAAGSLGDGVSAAAPIATAHQEALTRGMVGEVNTFTVNDGNTADWSTTLSPPSIGERGTDPLGVIFVCRVGAASGQHFAFAAYEDVPPPEPGTGSLPGGSLGSEEGDGILGSLGSNGDANGDDNGNGDGDDNGDGDGDDNGDEGGGDDD